MSSLGLQGAPLVTHPSVSGSKFIRAMTDLVNGRAPDSAMLARMWSAKVIDHHDVGVSRSSVVDQPFLVRRYANPAISKDFERTFLHESNSPDSLSCEVEDFDTPLLREKYVLGLEVAIHDPSLVRCRQFLSHLHGIVDRLPDRGAATCRRCGSGIGTTVNVVDANHRGCVRDRQQGS